MPNDESELSESEDALIKNIAIILGNVTKIYQSFPKQLFIIITGLISALLFIINIISAIFEYDKIDFAIVLDIILNPLFFVILILIIIISFVISLIKGFYNYISKNEKSIYKMEQDLLKTDTDCIDKLELIKQQNIAKPIFTNNSLIKNMIREIENYIKLKENHELLEKYLPILEVKLASNKTIEITASNDDDSSIIAKRMIFEIYRKKQISGFSVYDPYGLVSVIAPSEESFKSILIDSQPEGDYWDKTVVYLKENTCKRVDDFYLKIENPKEISRTTNGTLYDLLHGLNQL